MSAGPNARRCPHRTPIPARYIAHTQVIRVENQDPPCEARPKGYVVGASIPRTCFETVTRLRFAATFPTLALRSASRNSHAAHTPDTLFFHPAHQSCIRSHCIDQHAAIGPAAPQQMSVPI